MEMIKFRRRYCKNILVQMVIFGLLTVIIAFWQSQTIKSLYFENQVLQLGLVINGLIIFLFLAGLTKIIILLLAYSREEEAIEQFLDNMSQDPENPLEDVGSKSLIAQRFMVMQHLYESRTPINLGTMTSTLLANESNKIGLPRFINNVLILTGVFGTIVALSIALIGASDMLQTAVESGGMGMVIHGMSTALSTTMTAIACYFFFGYFYYKTTDVQTNLVAAIEEVTNVHLTPKFQVTNENVIYEMTGLLRMLQQLVKKMDHSQLQFGKMENTMAHAIGRFNEQTEAMPAELDELKGILREGFRLEDHSNPTVLTADHLE